MREMPANRILYLALLILSTRGIDIKSFKDSAVKPSLTPSEVLAFIPHPPQVPGIHLEYSDKFYFPPVFPVEWREEEPWSLGVGENTGGYSKDDE